MVTLYFILLLLFVFFMFCIKEIFNLKKEVRKLNKIVKHLLDRDTKN